MRHPRIAVGIAALMLASGSVAAVASVHGAAAIGHGNNGSSSASCNDGTVTASPAILWPPNHKMTTVTLSYAETNSSGGVGDGDNDNISLTKVTVTMLDGSNAANTEGNGSGAPVQLGGDSSVPSPLPAAVPDTQTWSVPIQVRNERAGTDGNGSGRIYQITVACNDDGGSLDANDPTEVAGQNGMATVAVCVPHDQSAASRAFCQAATSGS